MIDSKVVADYHLRKGFMRYLSRVHWKLPVDSSTASAYIHKVVNL